MSSEDTFHGWACSGKGQPLEWQEMPLKKFDDDTVEIKVTHCGICGSDIHTLDSGWSPTDYPCVVGHEITGVVTKTGRRVDRVKVGDRVGIGAQSGSCLECENCKSGAENMCEKGMTGTYNGRWKNGDKSFGGYADKWRGHQHFVFKIPEHLSNEDAATFFCGGVTTLAPLMRYNVNETSKVGVIGIGGLGHFGCLWSKALGAQVVALSHSERKRQDAKELGCSDFVVTSNPDEMAKHKNTLTHILCASYQTDFDWASYLGLLKHNGIFILVAAPEAPLQGIPPLMILGKQIQLSGSMIGSPSEIEKMLKFAEEHNVRPWINKYKMSDAPKAVEDFRQGKPRYRFVLEN